MLGWDPQRLTALYAAARDAATAMRTASGMVSFLHDVEPALAEADALLRRVVLEWEEDLLPAIARVAGSSFADEAAAVLRAWMASASPAATTDHRPNPADALLQRMLDDPDDPSLAAAFVLRAAEEPSLLFDTAADCRLAQRVALVGTRALSPADAERAVLTIIEWFRRYDISHNPVDESYQRDWRQFLVGLVTPWTLHFSPLHTGWQSSPARRAELLAFVVRDLASLEELLQGAAQVVDEVVDAVAHGVSGLDLAELLGSYLGLLGGLAIDVRADDEAARRAVWHRVWLVAGTVAGAVAGTFSGSVLAPSATKGTVIVAERLSQPFRPDPDRAARDAEYAHRSMLVVAADTLAAAAAAQWIDDGILPRDVPPPPSADPTAKDPLTDYVRRFVAWRNRLPGGPDGDAALRLTALVWSVLGADEAGRATADSAG